MGFLPYNLLKSVMYDELKLKFLIRQRVDQYNNDQKSLYYNRYVLKIVQAILLLLVLGVLGTFLFTLTTPYFLTTDILSDAIAIMFSGCLISLIVSGAVIFFILKKIKKSRQNKEIVIQQFESKDEEEIDAGESNLSSELAVKKIAPTKGKQTFLGRLLSVFSLSKDLFMMIIKDILSLSDPPDRIYFDNNKMDFAIWILNEIENHNNYCMSFSFVEENYENVSSRWVTIAITELEKVKVLRAIKDDDNKDLILLDLDFYDPADYLL